MVCSMVLLLWLLLSVIKVGSTEFTLADDILTIIAGDDKPIKCVYGR